MVGATVGYLNYSLSWTANNNVFWDHSKDADPSYHGEGGDSVGKSFSTGSAYVSYQVAFWAARLVGFSFELTSPFGLDGGRFAEFLVMVGAGH